MIILSGQHLPAGLTLEHPDQLLLPLHPDPAGCPHTADQPHPDVL